jgi:hypothetical protein
MPHRQTHGSPDLPHKQNLVYFFLPSGFMHRKCISEQTRMFQNFLRNLECLYLPFRQPSSLLQATDRLQKSPPSGSSPMNWAGVQRPNVLCLCPSSSSPTIPYIITLLYLLYFSIRPTIEESD